MRAANLPPKVTDTHVYFFGYEGPEPENCFQQWYPSPMQDPKSNPPAQFTTAEQYMMYQKALLMDDIVTATKILASATPAEAKALGREVKNFSQQKWDAECDRIVEEGNWLKFSQNKDCMQALLSTDSKVLVEASPTDRIWGVGFAPDEAEGRDAEYGENKLGKALMRVRDRLVRDVR